MFDSVVKFYQNLTWLEFIAYFWPFFIIDFTRYVIIEYAVITYRFIKERFYGASLKRARSLLFRERPLISVLVPGKNEGKHLDKLAETISRQTYKNVELIVVDDGSDDNTPIIGRSLEKNKKIDLFLRNETRGGKASAANTALRFAQGEFIVHLDADSHLSHDAIEQLLIPFYRYKNVGAVGGDIRVYNIERSLAAKLQAIEYLKSILTGRTVSSELGILRIISGACGAFRRKALERVHGWDVGPGLDGDITLKIRKLDYKVVHQPRARCYTNAPITFKKLAKQRYRWDKSLIRFRLRKHVNLIKPKSIFGPKNILTILDNLFFNLLLDIKWFLYVIPIILTDPKNLGNIFLINYVLYFFGNVLQFVLVMIAAENTLKSKEYFLALYLPLIPFYTGIYLRIIRTFSYLMEAIHKRSYNDSWNPWKVSSLAKKNRL